MTQREELLRAIALAESALAVAIDELALFDNSPANNVFSTLEEAESRVEGRLLNQASNDCEGAYNCGVEEYTQEFRVGTETEYKSYIGKLTVEYNRHDKTYYYVDGHDFTVTEVLSD